MVRRRLLPLLVLVALMVAPFGRAAMAEAMTLPAASAAAFSHCDEPATHHTPATPDDPDPAKMDCLSACAVIAPAAGPAIAQPSAGPATIETLIPDNPPGLTPEAEPPPPRLS